ncbi:unnamed protein product [Discosporangium mesarthrocarpum]
MDSNATRRRPAPRPCPAPDPARYSASVNKIVGHLRKMILHQAWTAWKPRLTQGQVAIQLLERQRERLGRSENL